MFALALKDFSLIGRRAWLLAGLAFFLFLYWTNPTIGLAFSLFPPLYATAWACGMDFRYKADSFVACLPLGRASIVAARFLTIPMAWAAGFAAALIPWAIRSAFGPFIPAAALPGIAAVSLATALVSNSLYLCAYYVFGYQNARWVLFIFFGGIGALGSIFKGTGSGSAEVGVAGVNAIVGGHAEAGIYAAVLAIALVVCAVAFATALAGYRRKEF